MVMAPAGFGVVTVTRTVVRPDAAASTGTIRSLRPGSSVKAGRSSCVKSILSEVSSRTTVAGAARLFTSVTGKSALRSVKVIGPRPMNSTPAVPCVAC